MRAALVRLIVAAGLVASLTGAAAADCNTPICREQGGARLSVGSGGSLDVESGGELDIESGGALKIAGTAVLPVGGVAGGYKVARGETALDGSNPTAAATGLTSIVACAVGLKGSSAPGVGTSVITYATSSGTLSLYAWKVTASGDATLVASTGTETVGWVCVGT